MNRTFTDAWVRSALGLGPGDDRRYSEICTDTRTIAAEALFVTLVGERFDAHDFLTQARDAGATGAVVRRGTPPVDGLVSYEVDDTLHALGDLAAAQRRRFDGPVIAITGQNGKTSTKEMVAAVLGTRWQTHKTRANLNNLVGVPLTVLEAPGATEALVVEAGANQPGEIARYREILRPDIAIVTSAGQGHLEGFGSVAGVVREKLSLTVDAPLAIVGIDPPELRPGAAALARRVITAGLRDADVVPDAVSLTDDGRAEVTIDGRRFTLAARGLHQAGNAMFAWAVAREYGLDLDACAAALEQFALPSGRGELVRHGAMTILNDCYNANPQSFSAAIDLARSLRSGRRLVFVAGTMRELGAESPALHAEIAAKLAALDPDLLVLVGEFVPAFAPWRARFAGRLLESADAPSVAGPLAARLEGDELLVLKASRGVALERILPAILALPVIST
jgi:UDP-N-acetylmuramoyl-tripeptide--D-alanyl-D-alanine ligase